MLKAKAVTDTTGMTSLAKAYRERAITLKAVKAGSKRVQSAMRASAPQRPGGGGLRQAIGEKAVKGHVGKTEAIAVVGVRTDVVRKYKGRRYVPGLIAHLVDQGTQAHPLGKRASKKAGPAAGGLHPGAKATRFVQRSWGSSRARAAAAAMDVMKEESKKALAQASAETNAKAKRN